MLYIFYGSRTVACLTSAALHVCSCLEREAGLFTTGSRGPNTLTTHQASEGVRQWRDKAKLSRDLCLYNARGTAATRLLNAGLSLAEITNHVGWSVRYAYSVIEHYARVSPDETTLFWSNWLRQKGAAEPGEYYNAFDGGYGGLWRRNGRAPQQLVGIGFAAQGEFFGDPYCRVCTDPDYNWVFEGIEGELIGDFGLSGNGAAGFELDHMDHRLGTLETTVLLARSVTRDTGFMLVPEEQLTHLTNLTGGTAKEAMHADMIYAEYPSGGCIFATGSITFCGSLPSNNFDNNVSRLLGNVMQRLLN